MNKNEELETARHFATHYDGMLWTLISALFFSAIGLLYLSINLCGFEKCTTNILYFDETQLLYFIWGIKSILLVLGMIVLLFFTINFKKASKRKEMYFDYLKSFEKEGFLKEKREELEKSFVFKITKGNQWVEFGIYLILGLYFAAILIYLSLLDLVLLNMANINVILLIFVWVACSERIYSVLKNK